MEEKIGGLHILVTGGAGFVGSNLCIKLKQNYPGYTIFAFDNLKRRGSELNLIRLRDHDVRFIHGDIRNPEDFLEIEHIDILIDASADPSVLAGINTPVLPLVNSNLVGTINCIELAQKHNAVFVFLSTSRVYPIKSLEACRFNEMDTRFEWADEQKMKGVSSRGITEEFTLEGSRSFYGTSKLCSELLLSEYHELKGLKTIINRFGVISGPWQMGKVDQGVLVLWLARHFFKGELSYIGYGGEGKQMRDVIHVDDVYSLVNHQIHNPDLYNGQVLNAGGGRNVSFSLQELTTLCNEVTGNKIKINRVEENRVADIRIYVSDYSKLHNLSGWAPKKSTADLVADTFLWIKENEKGLKKILA